MAIKKNSFKLEEILFALIKNSLQSNSPVVNTPYLFNNIIKEIKMKLIIRRINELTGKGASLDVYVNGEVKGSIKPAGEIELNIKESEVEVYVKTSWCESNRLKITSDSTLKAHARGGLLGATLLSLLRPKKTYILEKDA